MKLIFGLVMAVLLSGCSTTLFKGTFENRLACSMDGKEVYFLSKYGWVSVGAEISPKDLPAECKRITPS